jgi:two-component system sensor histidine kinase MprB
MSLRARVVATTVVVLTVTMTAASVFTYLIERHTLRSNLDRSLAARVASLVAAKASVAATAGSPSLLSGQSGYVQLTNSDGRVLAPRPARLPVDAAVRAVAAGSRGRLFRTLRIAGVKLRMLVAPVGGGVAAQAALPTAESDRTLAELRKLLTIAVLAGIALAAIVTSVLSRRALGPVRELAARADAIAVRADPTARLPAARHELAPLGDAVNRLLEALERLVTAHRQLVADASHELRTPITGIRTNLELIAEHQDGDSESRELLTDALAQVVELGSLTGSLLELAHAAETAPQLEETSLVSLAAEVVGEYRERHPALRLHTGRIDGLVVVDGLRLRRALTNLLDNALKWSPRAPVDVTVSGTEITIRDHGPGIADEDLPRIFDRFYRSASVRSSPGAGLGLAIARQLVEAHGGTLTAENADPGAMFRMQLPPLPPTATKSRLRSDSNNGPRAHQRRATR